MKTKAVISLAVATVVTGISAYVPLGVLFGITFLASLLIPAGSRARTPV